MMMEGTEELRKGNMRTLEEKVDILVRYCMADSEQQRRHYFVDLQTLLGAPTQRDVKSEIDRALSDLGVPDHLLGYAYLQAAISMVVQQPEAAYAITSCVYPGVAMRFGTTAQLVERAIRLLTSTDLSVEEISSRLGYENPSCFTAFFRKNTGLTPTQFRKRALQERSV